MGGGSFDNQEWIELDSDWSDSEKLGGKAFPGTGGLVGWGGGERKIEGEERVEGAGEPILTVPAPSPDSTFHSYRFNKYTGACTNPRHKTPG